MASLPLQTSLYTLARRPLCPQCLRALPSTTSTPPHQQTRNATLLRRPRRPYSFTQLVQLSDGSVFIQRTSSPQPVYKSTKDTRNTALWNPSSDRLMNIEADDAGRLALFRKRFGRGWDSKAAGKREKKEEVKGKGKGDVDEKNEVVGVEAEMGKGKDSGVKKQTGTSVYDDEDDNLLDLITAYGQKELKKSKRGKK